MGFCTCCWKDSQKGYHKLCLPHASSEPALGRDINVESLLGVPLRFVVECTLAMPTATTGNVVVTAVVYTAARPVLLLWLHTKQGISAAVVVAATLVTLLMI